MTTALTVRSRVPSFVCQALGLSLLIAAGAHVSVPFWPVPMTLQTFCVMAIAGACGWRLGVAAMLAYLAEGAIGLPVFASGAGVAVLIGPTAGYLAGMIAAALIVGVARGPVQRGLAILAGTAVIYLCGVTWLSGFVGIDRAIALGMLPFLLGDAVKGALAWALASALSPRAT